MTQQADPRMHQIRYGGKRFQMEYVFPAEIAVLRAHRSGQFQELPVLEWIKKQARRGVYFDAGAHVGNHSLFFHAFCPSTHVISVEAHPEIYKLLERNVDRNKTSDIKPWYLHNAAVWGEHTTVRIGAIPRNNAGHTKVVKDGGNEVPARTVDELAEGMKIAVLKIDVEDSEDQVFNGMQGTLRAHKPLLIVERHTPEQLAGFDKALGGFGYSRVANWQGIHTYAWA